jgi:hypothetical protein
MVFQDTRETEEWEFLTRVRLLLLFSFSLNFFTCRVACYFSVHDFLSLPPFMLKDQIDSISAFLRLANVVHCCFIFMNSLHGLVRGDNMELGRDSDTGGQVSAAF